jgi:hypothetical protein
MPRLPLTTYQTAPPMPVGDAAGRRLLIPRLQFRCLIRLPNSLLPRDGIIDVGSPLSWFPEDVWKHFRPGTDFEELPFELGYTPPRGQTAGWVFTFRMVRMLHAVVLFDLGSSTELVRDGVIVQLADGNPPASAPNRPARVVIGLWGGVLEGTSLRIGTDPATGHAIGSLEW